MRTGCTNTDRDLFLTTALFSENLEKNDINASSEPA